MTPLPLFQIDAFTDKVFSGNPACVVPLEQWLPDDVLLRIAKENAVAETAFFVPDGEGFHLRWFTPEIEMDLCGHATLATAHVLKTELGFQGREISFSSRSGMLKVLMQDHRYVLDFPSRMPLPASLPSLIVEALNIQPLEVLKSRDYVLVYASEAQVRDIKIDRVLFDRINLDPGGVIVTAKGENCDFVSRFFTPQSSILEDPVTGSAHCSLIPYWSVRLGKKDLEAWQVSDRLGKLYCSDRGERVLIGGHAVSYSRGTITV
jgi:PhzF family phenazine biosynthesis protein